MANMSRKNWAGNYTIGIYDVVKEGRKWVVYGQGWKTNDLMGKFATFDDAHRFCTGESTKD